MPVRIKDWMIPYTWWQWIEITNNHVINVLLREMNNLIQVNGDRELYVDLQLPSGIKPTDTFPVGVTTGKILQADWWQQSWLILNWKTTSWDYNRLIYANDGKLYIDKGNGVWVELGWDTHRELILTYSDLEQDQVDKWLIVANVWNPVTWTVVNLTFEFVQWILDRISFDGGTTEMNLIYPCGNYVSHNSWGTTPLNEFDMPVTYDCWLTWIVINNKVYVWDFRNVETWA